MQIQELQPKIQITNVRGEVIDLSNYAFQNFKYSEDISIGFPTIEFSLQDNLYQLLQQRLYGDEILTVTSFVEDGFSIKNKDFKIKSIGSMGQYPKVSSRQDVKLIAIDKVYDGILEASKSVYFEAGEKKSVTKLVQKFLSTNNVIDTSTFKINIPVESAPLVESGFNNLWIPYSKDAMKVMRMMANYAVTPDGRGGYVFFINRDGLFYLPLFKLFETTWPYHYLQNKTQTTFPYLRILESNDIYKFNKVKLSTFNSFTNFLTGHKKKIFGFNSKEKDINYLTYEVDAKYKEYGQYLESPEKEANVRLDGNRIPFNKDFKAGNIMSYFTPADNPVMLKGISDSIYYAQMFNYVLDIEMQGVGLHDWKAGDVIAVEFFTSTDDKWDSLNGAWLVKGFDLVFPGNHMKVQLTRMGSGDGRGILPDAQYTIIG